MTEIVRLSSLTATGAANQKNADRSNAQIRGGVISIGNFDGVHRGHANLLAEVRRHADRLSGPAIAVVLDPHPATILRPDRLPAKLTCLPRRAERMSRLGIDFLVICETSPEFLKLTAESFFRSLVVDRLSCRGIVEGPNFFFGRGRSGNVDLLRSMCEKANIELDIVQPTLIDGTMISSTRVRQLLEVGDVGSAASLLEGYHQLRGVVIHGDHRGREIGFPTANLAEIDVVVPAEGVYGGNAIVEGDQYAAAIHTGPRPTFEDSAVDDTSPSVEVHLLDYTGDLYGKTLKVDFITRVRDIARFESANELADQLKLDVQTIRERLLKKET